ncbi:LacI family DNA-binding transcriptional regulator [Niameybacter massiliensis]|uniref:LacI family DNA-binding transcriptional regulator n=1 Tax=Niameybacter massiliensis TaxID=1658108 RepID=UPI0006B50BD8|nr:LacI family DNA-binding transcriptional regulator [Niameybacter massiliensis]
MNIKDIARLSGVGVSTVSRVVNNHPDVKKETREHVLNIIKEYNYIPNSSARVLKQISTKNIGILIKGIFNPFLSEMVSIISKKIQFEGYTMLLQHTEVEEDDIESTLRFIKERKLQGVICLGGKFNDIQEDTFKHIDVPIILTSINLPVAMNNKQHVSIIDINNEEAAYKAVNYLIEKGHKDISIMICDEKEAASLERYKGYCRALEESDIPFDKENVLKGHYLMEKAYEETIKLLQNKKPTAIFAVSDSMAIGVAKAITDSGLQIGQDISIVGFDGMDIAQYYTPTITTVKQPREEMAKLSADLLFEQLNGNNQSISILLDADLIEGNSCIEI